MAIAKVAAAIALLVDDERASQRSRSRAFTSPVRRGGDRRFVDFARQGSSRVKAWRVRVDECGMGPVSCEPVGRLGLRAAWLAELDIAAVATDRSGVVCGWNDAAAKLYGRAEREMLGVSVQTLVPARWDDAVGATLLRELRETGWWRGELEIRDARGTALRLDVRITAVLDRDGEPVGFEAAFVDLSDRVRAERRASEVESRLRLAHRIAALGSWEWDPREDRLMTSDAFTSLLGLAPGTELTMAGALAVMPSDDQVRMRSAIDAMRSGGSDFFSVEFRVRGADGQLRRLEGHCGAVRDADGTLVRVWGTTQDVSERVRAGDRSQEAGEFWQETLDSLMAHVAVLDEQGQIVAVNAAWRRFADSECAGSDYVGCNYIAVCAAAADPLAAAVAVALRELLAGERDVFELEYPCHSPSVERWFVLRATRYKGSGPYRVVVAHQNITLRHEAQEQVFHQAALLDEIDVSVIVTDLDLTVLSWNAGAERLYGWSADQTIGRPASETILPLNSALPADQEEFNVALARDGRWDGEYTVRRADGSTFLAYVRSRLISDQDGRQIGVVNVAMDITEARESARALQSVSNYLRAVTDSMGQGVLTLDSEGRVRYMNQVAKDLLGRSWEDFQGKELHPLVHSVRLDGTPLPLEESPIFRARRDGEMVRVADDVFTRSDGSQLPVAYTAAPFSTDGIEGCVVLFEDITNRKAAAERVERDLEKLAWLERIQEALSEERFVLHAQPIIDLKTGRVAQSELLLRMRDTPNADGTAALIAPGCFLPIAEEYGLITEIDRWVIDCSIGIAATGQPVEINVSARSVSDPTLVDYIKHAIERAGADPATIVFEITETALISDEAAARHFVEDLHDHGCKIALDDFGTGYGGFTYLKQLPIDFLKIDIEFVRDLLTSSASRHVVQATVSLAAGFGTKTVGEGVEDQETLSLLRELGVDYAQGFHIGHPEPMLQATDRGSTVHVSKGALVDASGLQPIEGRCINSDPNTASPGPESRSTAPPLDAPDTPGFRAIFERALDPMLVANDEARYVDANPAACEFFGLPVSGLCKRRVVDFTPPAARSEFDHAWQTFLAAGKQQGEYQLQLPDGRIREIEFSATADILPGRHLSIFRDITDRKTVEAERAQLMIDIGKLARTDQLTGLPNRRRWTERFEEELLRAKRSGEPLSIAIIDLDDFKALNDSHGHAAGDRLLTVLAGRWQTKLRETDVLARIGGDEFGLLLPGCPAGDESRIVQPMRDAMPPDQRFSVGTAVWNRKESAERLLERADQALYRHKMSGSNEVHES